MEKTDLWSKELVALLRSAWLHPHAVSPSPYAPRRVIKAMKIMFSGMQGSLNKWF